MALAWFRLPVLPYLPKAPAFCQPLSHILLAQRKRWAQSGPVRQSILGSTCCVMLNECLLSEFVSPSVLGTQRGVTVECDILRCVGASGGGRGSCGHESAGRASDSHSWPDLEGTFGSAAQQRGWRGEELGSQQDAHLKPGLHTGAYLNGLASHLLSCHLPGPGHQHLPLNTARNLLTSLPQQPVIYSFSRDLLKLEIRSKNISRPAPV